ncbi:hypothetical protein GCM10027605_01630 [Micromonospora zhanjiangensis]
MPAATFLAGTASWAGTAFLAGVALFVAAAFLAGAASSAGVASCTGAGSFAGVARRTGAAFLAGVFRVGTASVAGVLPVGGVVPPLPAASVGGVVPLPGVVLARGGRSGSGSARTGGEVGGWNSTPGTWRGAGRAGAGRPVGSDRAGPAGSGCGDPAAVRCCGWAGVDRCAGSAAGRVPRERGADVDRGRLLGSRDGCSSIARQPNRVDRSSPLGNGQSFGLLPGPDAGRHPRTVRDGMIWPVSEV